MSQSPGSSAANLGLPDVSHCRDSADSSHRDSRRGKTKTPTHVVINGGNHSEGNPTKSEVESKNHVQNGESKRVKNKKGKLKRGHSDDFEGPTSSKRKRRGRARSKLGEKETKKVKFHLPLHLEQMHNMYVCLDAALMFLDARGAPLKVDVVCAFVSSLRQVRFNPEDLARIWRFSGGIFSINWQSQPGTDELVLAVVLNDDKSRWRGKRAQMNRSAVVRERLEAYAQEQMEGKSYSAEGASLAETSEVVPLPSPCKFPVHPSKKGAEDEDSCCPVPDEYIRTRKVDEMLEHLQSLPWYEDQIKYINHFPARSAKYNGLGSNVELHPRLLQALSSHSVTNLHNDGQKSNFQFYAHQSMGIRAVLEGQNVAVSTGTGSGKSLIAYVPVIDAVLKNPNRTSSLFLFPTKALGQDQISSLKNLVSKIAIVNPSASAREHGSSGNVPFSSDLNKTVSICTLDGDTPLADREPAKCAHIILTNPDLLHATLLPNHEKYRALFSKLKFIVVDEAHVYRGVFGCHVSAVFRRLLRVCEIYGADPQFITFTATIANPRKHFHMLVGNGIAHEKNHGSSSRPLTVITSEFDGSPRGARHWLLWNPPLKKLPEPKKTDVSSEQNVSGAVSASPPTSSLSAAGHSTTNFLTSTQREPSHSTSESTSSTDRVDCIVKGTRAVPTLEIADHRELLSSPERAKRRLRARAIRLQRLMVSQSLSRRSSIYETSLLLTTMVLANLRTIVFVRVRKLVELVVKYSRAQLLASPRPELARRICSYRAGYTKAKRRQLESQIFSGEMRGTVSTNALELGIDIGTLDVVIILGFPGSISSLWQQSGRSGRGHREAMNIMVAWDSPVDQYFCSSPNELFSRKPEAAVLDPCNPHVLKEHLPCCAAEHPLIGCSAGKLCKGSACSCGTVSHTSAAISEKLEKPKHSHAGKIAKDLVKLQIGSDAHRWSSDAYYNTLSILNSERLLIPLTDRQPKASGTSANLQMWAPHPVLERPARRVNLRSIDEVQIDVVREDTGEKIDSIERFRSYWEVHPGAVYANASEQFIVLDLDLDRKLATVRPTRKLNYYTSVQDHTDVNVLTRLAQWNPSQQQMNAGENTQSSMPLSDAPIYFGRVEITTKVWGYRKHHVKTQRIFDTMPLVLPHIAYASVGFWIDLASNVRTRVEEAGCDFLGSIHGANHALRTCIPFIVASENLDTGCECPSIYQVRARPLRLVIFDAHPGGIGIAERVFACAGELVKIARDLVKSCKCTLETGCPSCVLDTNCREHNDVMDKRGALLVLESVCSVIGL